MSKKTGGARNNDLNNDIKIKTKLGYVRVSLPQFLIQSRVWFVLSPCIKHTNKIIKHDWNYAHSKHTHLQLWWAAPQKTHWFVFSLLWARWQHVCLSLRACVALSLSHRVSLLPCSKPIRAHLTTPIRVQQVWWRKTDWWSVQSRV